MDTCSRWAVSLGRRSVRLPHGSESGWSRCRHRARSVAHRLGEEMARRALGGENVNTIRRWLDREGALLPSGQQWRRRGPGWGRSEPRSIVPDGVRLGAHLTSSRVPQPPEWDPGMGVHRRSRGSDRLHRHQGFATPPRPARSGSARPTTHPSLARESVLAFAETIDRHTGARRTNESR